VRKLVVHMQTTLDNRIANDQGVFWEPFPWGQVEQDYINGHYAQADTWVMSRPIYEAVVPWWETVARGEVPDDVEGITEIDREFARLLAGMTKVVVSRSLAAAPGREVVEGDIAAHLAKLKAGEGRDIILSCGPATLAPLTAAPGLIDEYLVVVHPAVLGSGPRMFGDNTTDLGLRLAEHKVFDGGCAVLRYETLGGPDR
jgi:dihydrofolate reductase